MDKTSSRVEVRSPTCHARPELGERFGWCALRGLVPARFVLGQAVDHVLLHHRRQFQLGSGTLAGGAGVSIAPAGESHAGPQSERAGPQHDGVLILDHPFVFVGLLIVVQEAPTSRAGGDGTLLVGAPCRHDDSLALLAHADEGRLRFERRLFPQVLEHFPSDLLVEVGDRLLDGRDGVRLSLFQGLERDPRDQPQGSLAPVAPDGDGATVVEDDVSDLHDCLVDLVLRIAFERIRIVLPQRWGVAEFDLRHRLLDSFHVGTGPDVERFEVGADRIALTNLPHLHRVRRTRHADDGHLLVRHALDHFLVPIGLEARAEVASTASEQPVPEGFDLELLSVLMVHQRLGRRTHPAQDCPEGILLLARRFGHHAAVQGEEVVTLLPQGVRPLEVATPGHAHDVQSHLLGLPELYAPESHRPDCVHRPGRPRFRVRHTTEVVDFSALESNCFAVSHGINPLGFCSPRRL